MAIRLEELAVRLADRIERLQSESLRLTRKASGSVDARTRNHYRNEARYTRNKAKMLKARLEKLNDLMATIAEERKWH